MRAVASKGLQQPQQPASRESTPNLLEPLNYEIIQLDDDDEEEDDDDEDEVVQEVEQQQELEQLEEEENDVLEVSPQTLEEENPELKHVVQVTAELDKGKRKLKTSSNNLLVDISQSIKWHEIIQENSESENKPKLKKLKLQ